MKRPDFLTLDDLLALHADRIERFGGATGLRDPAALLSALAMPAASFGGRFLHPTLPEMAAAYVFQVSQAQAFVDGNKRAGLAAALAFLWLNGHELICDTDSLHDLVLGVAAGERSKSDVAVFFARHVRRLAR